jgi:diguanylate cyclase (GGDEF)-like protein
VTREASGIEDLLGSPGDDRRHRESPGVAFAVCDAGRSIGALVVLAPLQMIDDSTRDHLLTLIDEAGQLMGQQVAERFAREVGLIDAITGNPNRPALDKAMRESILKRCSLVCMAVDQVSTLDIDRGNAVLRQVASLLRKNLRGYDVAARTGGEEFALFLPGADLDSAVIVADRVRKAVVEWHFDLDRERTVTCSLGVASIPDTVSEVDNLMEAAKGARVEARASGPNRIATLH